MTDHGTGWERDRRVHFDGNLAEPSARLDDFGFEDLRSYGFQDVSQKFYDVKWMFGADEYIAFLDTLSDHRALPENNKNLLYAETKKAVIKHGGHYNMDYVFQLYRGRKTGKG